MSPNMANAMAWEMAVAQAFLSKTKARRVESPHMEACLEALVAHPDKVRYLAAAFKAVDRLIEIDPRLAVDDRFEAARTRTVAMPTPQAGGTGNPADVVVELGRAVSVHVSCKKRSASIKHPRISPVLNWGKEWTGFGVGRPYWESIQGDFAYVERWYGQHWNEMDPAVKLKLYEDVMATFIIELNRLVKKHGAPFVTALWRFMVGSEDHYRVVYWRNGRERLEIAAVNRGGTLPVPQWIAPTKIVRIEGRLPHVVLVMNQGWSLDLRLHNASSKVENSLKWDVRLTAMPDYAQSQEVPLR